MHTLLAFLFKFKLFFKPKILPVFKVFISFFKKFFFILHIFNII